MSYRVMAQVMTAPEPPSLRGAFRSHGLLLLSHVYKSPILRPDRYPQLHFSYLSNFHKHISTMLALFSIWFLSSALFVSLTAANPLIEFGQEGPSAQKFLTQAIEYPTGGAGDCSAEKLDVIKAELPLLAEMLTLGPFPLSPADEWVKRFIPPSLRTQDQTKIIQDRFLALRNLISTGGPGSPLVKVTCDETLKDCKAGAAGSWLESERNLNLCRPFFELLPSAAGLPQDSSECNDKDSLITYDSRCRCFYL